MTQTHILYFSVRGNDNFTFGDFNNLMKSEDFNLLQLKYNLFDFLPRNFTISTKNGSYKFNIDMLKDTSSIIFDFLASNHQELEYHLDINDETNIMERIEQLYQGKLVTFNDNELLFSQKITEILGLSDCMPNLIKTMGITNRLNRYNRDPQQPFRLGLIQSLLIKFLQNDNIFPKFTIILNGTEYRCNVYAARSSKKINDFITQNPTSTEFTYENDSENDEFQIICDLFNFNKIKITNTNMHSIKQFSEELEIECLLQKVNEFIEKYEKNVQKIGDKQKLIDSIDEIFDLLYNRKNNKIENVRDSIMKSNWIKTEDNIIELSACFIQIISVDFIYHKFLFDLILLLNNESGKHCDLNLLMPTIKNNLMRSLGETLPNCAFVYRLFNNGFISKEEIFEKFFDLYENINAKSFTKSNSTSFNMDSNQDKNQMNLRVSNIFIWFYPELEKKDKILMNEISKIIQPSYLNFLKFYFTDKEEKYLEMRNVGEPNDAATNALLHDDIDSFQKIVSSVNDFANQKVPFNIYESPLKSEEITYINYAAAHGSLLCFKYLLLNHADIDACTLQYAVCGGNYEIIHTVDQHYIETSMQIDYINGMNSRFRFKSKNGPNLNLNPIFPAIYKHENDLFDWILQEKFLNNGQTGDQLKFLVEMSAKNGNAHCLINCIDNGFIFSSNFDDLISKAVEGGFYKYTQLLFNFLPKSVHLTKQSLKSSIIYGNLSIFEFVLKNYKSLNDFDMPLSTAIYYDHFRIIKYIVENEFNDKIKLSKSGIINCLSMSNSFVFKYLINQLGFDKIVADFNLNLGDLLSIANKACENANLENLKIITELVIKKFPEANFTTPFITAIEKQSVEICQYLIDKRIDLYTISKNSINYNSINEKIFYLLIQKAEGEMKHLLFGNFFYQSIKSHNKEIVEFLLSQGIPYENALIEAAKSHDLEIVKILINHNRKPSFINQISKQGTALKIAVSNNDIEIVKFLLTVPGIDANLYDENNWTPLITSIYQFNIEMVEILLRYYDKSIQGQMWQLNKALQLILEYLTKSEEMMSKKTPNYYHGNINYEKPIKIDHKLVLIVIKKLIEIENIDLNCYAGNYTLLTYACKVNDIDLVKMLIESDKVNVNSYAPKSGNTPLMIALTNKNTEIAKLLIESPKTDINQRNYNKETALIIAATNDLPDIVSILINDKKFDKDESRLDYAFFISSGAIVSKLYQVDCLDVNYQHICKLDESLSNIELQDAYLFDTSLTNSVKQKDINKIRLIVNHPSFDPFKSQVKTAIFTSAKLDEVGIFQELLLLFNNDVNLYFKENESLLTYSAECRSENIINEILNNDTFDSDKSDILSAFCQILQYEIPNKQQQNNNNNNNFNLGNQVVDRNALYNSLIAIYDYDNNHNHLIDFSKLLPNGKSFLTSIASNFGNIDEIVHFLLEHGCDPDMPDQNGVYPLEHAINMNSPAFVHLLIETGRIDFDSKFNGPIEAMHIPNSFVYRKANFTFNAHKTNLGKQNELIRNDLTYLHLAAKCSDVKIFNELVGLNKIDINSVDNEGETPLFIAIRYFNVPVINRLFLLDDLDYMHTNIDCEDALELANKISEGGVDISKNRPNETKGDYLSKLLSIISRFINK